MYEELLQRLREAGETLDAMADFVVFPNLGMLANLMNEAADAIEELSRDLDSMNDANIALYGALPKWIPVTERLPKEMVLAHGRDGDIRSLEYSFTKKWWEDDDGYYCDTNYVTHWMRIPDPPKEES